MIVFNKLWDMMRQRNISQYRLIKVYRISSGELHRLRKNKNVSTYTLNRLCKLLDCRLDEIAEYQKDEE